jgi:hypothetical protein
MDEGGEILLLPRARGDVRCVGENRRDVAVQIHRRELDRVARHRADIEAVEPAICIHDSVSADAIAARLGVGRIGHLIEANGARSGLVHPERIPGQPPAPIGARHRIACALDLRQRGQQLGRDGVGGILAEQGSVLLPGFARRLVERPADDKEQLGRLADHLIDDVRQRDRREDRRCDESDPNRRRHGGQLPSRPPDALPATSRTKKGAPASPDALLANGWFVGGG